MSGTACAYDGAGTGACGVNAGCAVGHCCCVCTAWGAALGGAQVDGTVKGAGAVGAEAGALLDDASASCGFCTFSGAAVDGRAADGIGVPLEA